MIDRLNGALRFQSQALALRAERQTLIASNIANADTPGYQAVDADFASALRRVSNADPSNVAASRPELLAREVRTIAPSQASQDGNGVDMDAERARFADNSVKYEAALRALNHQVKSLLAVIQG